MIRTSRPKVEILRASYFIGVLGVPVFQWRVSAVFAGTPEFAGGVPRCSRTSWLTPAHGFEDSSQVKTTSSQPWPYRQASPKKQKKHMRFASTGLRHSQSARISGHLCTVSVLEGMSSLANGNFQLMPWVPHENAWAQKNTAGKSYVPPYGCLGPLCSTRLPSAPHAIRYRKGGIAQFKEGNARMTDSS